MRNPKSYILILFLFALISSCNSEKNKAVVTNKIQYDVNIQSPDPSWDWWIQNIAGPDREELLDLIIEGAKDGKFQAYDYYSNPISAKDVRSLFSDTLILRLRRTTDPFEEYDTTIINNITKQDILRLRFLEKWEINPDNLQMSKTIYGIAPIAKRIDFNGIERWQPMFWLYTDEDFIEKLNSR